MKRSNKLTVTVLLLLTLLLTTQCQKPMHILGRDKMQAVTKDMLLTEAYLQNQSNINDSVATLYYESILDKHGVSRAEYDSAIIWYGENAHRMIDIYDEITKELTTTKAELDTFLTDSIQRHRLRFIPVESLWEAPSRLYLTSNKRIWAHELTLNPDEVFSSHDTLTWQANVLPQKPEYLEITLQLLIHSDEAHLFQKIYSTEQHSKPWELIHHFILPDSLPFAPRYTLLMMLQKKDESILLDNIKLYKRSPHLSENLETYESEMEPPSEEQLQISEQDPNREETTQEMQEATR